jgi:hypothetical protein
MALAAGALSVESYSGACMEDDLARLSVAEAALDADVDYAAHLADATGASVAPQSSEDLCAALSGHSTSEHGVFAAGVENVVAQAVAFCGGDAAVEVWAFAAAALRAHGATALSRGAAAERAALDIHVVARVASRCAHELHAGAVGAVLGYAGTLADWLGRAMAHLSAASERDQQGVRPAMISGTPSSCCPG